MKPTTSRAALFVLLAFLLTAAIAGAQTPSRYRQGTITKIDPDAHKAYFLKGAEAIYEIKNCGDLQIGQAVDYRVDEFTIYIRRTGGGKDYKCTVGSVDTAVNTPDTPPAPKYQQGTILGYDVRRDTSVFGSSGANGIVYAGTRKTKVYQLKTATLLYKVDSCGDFGAFQVGQIVDFRLGPGIDGQRLYVRYDGDKGDKEFNCKIEGVSAVEGAKPDAAAPAETSAPH
ncbi:MAG: hypothetical protein WAN60_13765 [Candidatus Sulfotelmatobacter sp.]